MSDSTIVLMLTFISILISGSSLWMNYYAFRDAMHLDARLRRIEEARDER